MEYWVLGGTSGIGLAIVEELVEQREQPTLVLSEAEDAGAALDARGGARGVRAASGT